MILNKISCRTIIYFEHKFEVLNNEAKDERRHIQIILTFPVVHIIYLNFYFLGKTSEVWLLGPYLHRKINRSRPELYTLSDIP